MAVSTRMARALSAAAIAAVLVPAGALAAPPTHSVSPNLPIEFPAGTVCADTIRFENLSLNAKDTAFAPGPSGSQRILTRGSGVSRVTNLDSGATYDMRGGFRIQLTFGADGSLRADATGTDFIAYYFEGDPSVIGAGLFRVSGHLTEWYGPDGSYLGNAVHGNAVNLCDALGA